MYVCPTFCFSCLSFPSVELQDMGILHITGETRRTQTQVFSHGDLLSPAHPLLGWVRLNTRDLSRTVWILMHIPPLTPLAWTAFFPLASESLSPSRLRITASWESSATDLALKGLTDWTRVSDRAQRLNVPLQSRETTTPKDVFSESSFFSWENWGTDRKQSPINIQRKPGAKPRASDGQAYALPRQCSSCRGDSRAARPRGNTSVSIGLTVTTAAYFDV